jgi:N-acyl-D-amino-acid deacylase
MLGLKLDFNPGERYAYSNFGYCLLGRLIEQASEQRYEAYVGEHVFAPLGIERPRLGKTHADREPDENEVHYYSPDVQPSVFAEDAGKLVPSAYGGWNLEAMDSHGGWIASAVDLVRFAAAFDDPAKCMLLKDDSVARMFAAPIGLPNDGKKGDDTYYSCGWTNRPLENGEFDSWHTGSLPGTATLLVRRHDGRNLAIVFNARSSPEVSHFGQAMNDQLNKALDEIDQWPDADLFPEYFSN